MCKAGQHCNMSALHMLMSYTIHICSQLQHNLCSGHLAVAWFLYLCLSYNMVPSLCRC